MSNTDYEMDNRLLTKSELVDQMSRLRAKFGREWKDILRKNDAFYGTSKGERVLWAISTNRASEDKTRAAVDILLVQEPFFIPGRLTNKSTNVDDTTQELRMRATQASLNRLPKGQTLEELEAKRRKRMQKVNQ